MSDRQAYGWGPSAAWKSFEKQLWSTYYGQEEIRDHKGIQANSPAMLIQVKL